jgi:hypothetical protein
VLVDVEVMSDKLVGDGLLQVVAGRAELRQDGAPIALRESSAGDPDGSGRDRLAVAPLITASTGVVDFSWGSVDDHVAERMSI